MVKLITKEVSADDQLSSITIEGFKSIARCYLPLRRINVLIGCNGSGKSNFVSLFRMVQRMLDKSLQAFVGNQGGPDVFLHFGRKTTERMKVEFLFGNNGYRAVMEPTADNRLMFAAEEFYWNLRGWSTIGTGHFESASDTGTHSGVDDFVLPAMKRWRVYHFHDTGEKAPVKQLHGINDNQYIRPDAQNLAAFLHFLRERHNNSFQRIVKTVRLVAPFFGDFHLRPSPGNPDTIALEWTELGSDVPFLASQLSDGTLRFICLATVFLQPEELQPATIIVDEPELGLHPYAITVLGALMRTTSQKKQVIVSTQSVELLNEFDADDVVVVDRDAGKSALRRVDPKALAEWLDEFSIGDLWKKNLLGGRPAR
jgi:predicted ATPase